MTRRWRSSPLFLIAFAPLLQTPDFFRAADVPLVCEGDAFAKAMDGDRPLCMGPLRSAVCDPLFAIRPAATTDSGLQTPDVYYRLRTSSAIAAPLLQTPDFYYRLRTSSYYRCLLFLLFRFNRSCYPVQSILFRVIGYISRQVFDPVIGYIIRQVYMGFQSRKRLQQVAAGCGQDRSSAKYRILQERRRLMCGPKYTYRILSLQDE